MNLSAFLHKNEIKPIIKIIFTNMWHHCFYLRTETDLINDQVFILFPLESYHFNIHKNFLFFQNLLWDWNHNILGVIKDSL